MDVVLRQTLNDGDICLEDGVIVTDGGLQTAAYISLFGGNAADSGSQNSPAGWWGNVLETDPARQLISQTQHLLQGIPATSGNLIRIRNAVAADLNWLVSSGVASSVDSVVTITGLNLIRIAINIDAEGEPEQFQFFANWGDVNDPNNPDR